MIPLIIGAPRTISKSFIKYLSNITGKCEIKEIETAAILGTVRILQEGTNLTVQNIKCGK